MIASVILLLCLIVLGLTTPTVAQPSMVEVCTEASRLYYRADAATALNIENFPELDPPRVRMSVEIITTRELDAVAAMLAKQLGEPTETERRTLHNEVLCRFSRDGALSEFCGGDGCLFTDQERVEEVKVLLKRQAQ